VYEGNSYFSGPGKTMAVIKSVTAGIAELRSAIPTNLLYSCVISVALFTEQEISLLIAIIKKV